MMTGKVKWFDDKKGYGFIGRPDESDVFVHFNTIQGSGFKSLTEGEEVKYDLVETDKGPQARNVTRLNAPATA